MSDKASLPNPAGGILVSQFMTKNVVSIGPEEPLIKAAQILFDNNWDGLPVVTRDNRLIGIITQYDLVTKGANIHLPTFVQMLREFDVYKEDKSPVRKSLERIVTLKVKDVMNPEPFTVVPRHTIEQVAEFFSKHHRVNPIPVVDEGSRVVGIISRYDIIKLYAGSESIIDLINKEPDVNKKVDMFAEEFEKNYIFVSRLRPLFWHLAIPLFIIIGVLVAVAIILKIEYKKPEPKSLVPPFESGLNIPA